jgi:hypothetical protein
MNVKPKAAAVESAFRGSAVLQDGICRAGEAAGKLMIGRVAATLRRHKPMIS